MLLSLSIKAKAPMKSINQLRRVTKLITSFREKPNANPIRYPITKNCCTRL
jgi:hypothetical protein